LRLDEIGGKKWNILRHDLPFPVAVLKDAALKNNSQQMRKFLDVTGAYLSPHGKTTMSPQLFDRQLSDGAWGMTAATTAHVNVYRRAGIKRIFFANQLVGKENIAYIAKELRQDPEFQFYCLVDSLKQLDLMSGILSEQSLQRPMNILVEVGPQKGRCGVRSLEQGIELARCIAARDDIFSLAGIEAFEAVFSGDRLATSGKVNQLLELVVKIAESCDRENLFAGTDLLLTAGGSMYFARVAEIFKRAKLSREPTVLLRSGCYLTHDHGLYADSADFEKKQSGQTYPAFVPALEVWACVQSVPETGLAILSLGKRDISYDIELPKPCYHAQGSSLREVESGDFEITALNDQHAFMRCAAGSEPEIGDLIGLGVSHPCTTFDKWQLLYIVDDRYDVLEGIRTFF